MRYSVIKQLDIANGPGCRVSLFVQGCSFKCPGCFNPTTQDFSGGQAFTDQSREAIFKLAEPAHISGLSILGGEPLHPQNRQEVISLVKAFKEKYPNKTVWLWSGYQFEDVASELPTELDVLVDGLFIEAQKDLRLNYRGSANQRVIDVPESLKTSTIKLLDY